MLPDYNDLFDIYDREQARQQERLPDCSCCGGKIEDDFFYIIDGDYLCKECLDNEYRQEIENFISRE